MNLEEAKAVFKKASYPIHKAVRSGNLARVEAAVKASGDTLNSVEYEAEWHRVCAEYDGDRFDVVPNGNADNELEGRWTGAAWRTPLGEAASQGLVTIVNFLLQAGAKADVANCIDDSEPEWCLCPLALAAEGGHIAVVRSLLKAGAKVNTGCNFTYGVHPVLSHAARCTKPTALEIVKLLLDKRAPPDVRGGTGDERGMTPLHWAANLQAADVITALLDARANPNVKAARGTPLDLVVVSGMSHWPGAKVRGASGLDADRRMVAAYDVLRSGGARHCAELPGTARGGEKERRIRKLKRLIEDARRRIADTHKARGRRAAVLKRTMMVAVVAAVLVLTVCPNAREGMGAAGGALIGGLAGSKVGKGSGQMLATAVGAGLGMLAGASLGRKLDEHARMVAGEARTQALDAGLTGQAIQWDSPNAGGSGGAASGRVEVVRTGELGGQPCREYVHVVKIGGRDEQVRGVACRDAAGDWVDRDG